MSERLRRTLSAGLDPEVRHAFDRVVAHMTRELAYLEQTSDSHVDRAVAAGWTTDRIKVLLLLNAFHRVVIGPLDAAFTTITRSDLGSGIPIVYGKTIVVDSVTGATTRTAIKAYHGVLRRLGIKPLWLNVSRLADLLYILGQSVEET